MTERPFLTWCTTALAVLLAASLATPLRLDAQTVTGQARAVQVTDALGLSTTSLADTGTLADVGDARDASQTAGSAGSTVSAEALDAATMAWPDQVVSEVSATSVGVLLGTISITAETVTASVLAALNQPAQAAAAVGGLLINGTPIAVTGAPNQTIAIPGGQLVINEQTLTPSGATTVNALHLKVAGMADVVIGTATAGIR